MFRKDGRIVAGLGKLTEEGARSAWMICYGVADADATTAAVERAGGTVRVPPRDLDEWGRMARYTDPLGSQFAVRQPGRDTGVELVDEPGSLSWTELCTTDAAASRRFYGEVLGWSFGEMELPGGGGTYVLVTPAGLPEERMQGGVMEVPAEQLAPTGGRPYWQPVFAVSDCDTAAARVVAGGGQRADRPRGRGGRGGPGACVGPGPRPDQPWSGWGAATVARVHA